MKLAGEQLGKKPFDGHPLEILEPGIPQATKALQENSLEVTDENIFIAYACGEKGISFLKGEMKENIRKITTEAEADVKAPAQAKGASDPGNYTVTVDGKSFNVTVAEGTGTVQAIAPAAPATAIKGEPIVAAMPGSVLRIEVGVGDTVKEGDDILVLEAMKMETPVKAPKDCRIIAIEVAVGDNVQTGNTLAMIE